MVDEEDVDTLKRRGRRRLIGAIALVLLAVIVLPMVFDPEPKSITPPVQIRIPGEGEGGFTPKGPAGPAVVPPARVSSAPAPSAQQGARETTKAPESVESSSAVASTEPPPKALAQPEPGTAAAEKAAVAPAAKVAEAKRTETAAPRAGGYIVPVAAFANAEKLKEVAATLRSAKLPYYTEPIATEKGQVTRVRAGPFANREAAERARDKLRGLGLKPGSAVAREG